MTYKVLIVDDSKLARMAVAKALNNLHPDWQRFEAGNADEALARVKQDSPDIVLLDYNMPGKDGLAFAAALQKHSPRIIVAVISANRQTEVIERAHSVGAEFLHKPLTEAALQEFLVNAVKRHEAAAT